MFVFVIAWAIQMFGWRWTAFGSGVIAILVGYPLARVIRSRPEDHGLTIDGLPAAPKDASTKAGAPPPPAFSGRQAIRTGAFWLLSLGHAAALLVVIALNVHVITHIKQDMGYTLAQASLFFSLITAGQMFGVMLGWLIGERFVKRKVAAACLLMHAVGMILVTYAIGPFMQAIRADYFGRTSIGVILGLSTLITVFGNIGGPIIAGVFADIYGNYRAGFTLLAAVAAMGSLAFWMAKPPRHPSAI
jgi:sugar phosphate permease